MRPKFATFSLCLNLKNILDNQLNLSFKKKGTAAAYVGRREVFNIILALEIKSNKDNNILKGFINNTNNILNIWSFSEKCS